MAEMRTDSRSMMDKIIYYKTGHFLMDAGSMDGSRTTVEFEHRLPFTPLVFGIYATTPDFIDAKDFNVQFGAIFASFAADTKKIQGIIYNFSGNEFEFYYRLYAFEPSNSISHLQATAGDAHGFIINSGRFSYRKLYRNGIVDIRNQQATIVHGLGYRPQVMLWQESDNGIIEPLSQILADNKATIDNEILTIQSSAKRVHYRIYHDGIHER